MANHGKLSARMMVRRHVVDLIYRNPGRSVRVPSYNVLSKELGVARSTAQMELKHLVDEGFLIATVGVGTFTNPAANFSNYATKSNPLVALVVGDGKYLHHRYYDWALKSHVGMAVTAMPATLLDVVLYSEREEDLYEELRSIRCDAFVWISPPARLHRLIRRVAGLRPMITVDDFVEGVTGIDFDRRRKGFPVAEHLLAEGRERLLFCQSQRYHDTTFQAFREVYGKRGMELNDQFFLWDEKCLELIQTVLKEGYRPQAVMFCHELSEALVEVLTGYGIDLEEECRLVSPMYKPANLNAPMLCPAFPFAGYAGIAATELRRRIEAPDTPPEHIPAYCDFPVLLI